MSRADTMIPDRFLGYAFSVGDLLVELDEDFTILSLDGASTTLLGDVKPMSVGENFLDYISPAATALLLQRFKGMPEFGRVGPVDLSLGPAAMDRIDLIAFFGKLPNHPGRKYAVLTNKARFDALAQKNVTTREQVAEKFFDRIGEAFNSSREMARDTALTVVELDQSVTEDDWVRRKVHNFLAGQAISEQGVAELASGKFAVLRNRDDAINNDLGDRISAELEINVSSADVFAGEDLTSEDTLNAMIFTLRAYASGSGQVNIDTLKDDCDHLIAETTNRMRIFKMMLEKDEFSLVFQPIVDLKSGSAHHYEALARFDYEIDGMTRFDAILFAEQTGMIADFDRRVLSKALKKLWILRSAGKFLRIAVNVSGRSLSDPDFLEFLMQGLKESEGLSDQLHLEITESAKIEDLGALANALDQVRGMGFKVYLDDFGAGAAGFQYLRSLQIDALKIDGAYIRNALVDRKDRAFLRSMVSLCKELEIETVGEWVETKELARLLRDIGVDFGQGYYFGKPVPGIL